MRTKRKLLVEQLDRKLKPFSDTSNIIIPDRGWINTIRVTLNMTLEQLGSKLKMTRQGAKKVEESESSRTISIKSLMEIGEVLEMKFVYGFVPKHGSVQKLISYKAKALAEKIVLRTSQNMKLENQGNNDEQIKRAIRDLADELKREMSKSLWD